jgi:hypothetical protein
MQYDAALPYVDYDKTKRSVLLYNQFKHFKDRLDVMKPLADMASALIFFRLSFP